MARDGRQSKDLLNQFSKQPKTVFFAVVAEQLRKMKRLHQALEICQRGTRQNPRYVNGWFVLACIQMDLEQDHDATKTLNKVVAQDPDHIKAHERLCTLAIKRHDWHRAMAHIDAITVRYPLSRFAKHMSPYVTENAKKQSISDANRRSLTRMSDNNGFTKRKFRLKIVQKMRDLLSRPE